MAGFQPAVAGATPVRRSAVMVLAVARRVAYAQARARFPLTACEDKCYSSTLALGARSGSATLPSSIAESKCCSSTLASGVSRVGATPALSMG